MKNFGGKVIGILSKIPIYKGGNNGFGMNELLGTAAALILAAFIIIPGLRDFADLVMDRLNSWWTSISGTIFPST